MYATSSYDIFLRFHRKLWNMLFVGCFCITLSYADTTNDDWVRVYDGKIAEIYLQSDTTMDSTPISLDKVIIAIRADPKEKEYVDRNSPLILVEYMTGKRSKAGCIYTPNGLDIFKNFVGFASDECKKIQGLEKVQTAFHACYEMYHDTFFVSFDLSQTQCVNGLDGDDDVHRANLSIKPSHKDDYVIATWSSFNSDYKKIPFSEFKNYYRAERGSIRNYYNTYQNKIFGGEDYGQPFGRFTKEVPKNYAYDSSFYVEMNDPYDHVALWQKQYLIKTKGFYDSDLWWAWRVIDEPISIGINLNDGTALLKGVSSILRVRYVDGETKAPESTVKVKEPSEIRAYFNKHGGLQNCTGEDIAACGSCSLDYVPKYPESEKLTREDFYKTIIEATDKIIQEYFEQGDK